MLRERSELSSLVVHELERVDAPSRDVFEARYLRPGRPVILKNVAADWPLPPSEWTFERVAERYGDADVVAAALEGGKLADAPKEGVVFRKVRLREMIASLGRPGTGDLYVMAPTWNLGDQFQRDHRLPPYCEGA